VGAARPLGGVVMTKKERERLIKWGEAYRANCPCEDCRKYLQMAAELRRTSDYDQLQARLDAAENLLRVCAAREEGSEDFFDAEINSFLAATSEGAKHPPGPVSKSQAKRFAALDIPYADPGIEVGATTHRRVR
jgi:hypothetical protein